MLHQLKRHPVPIRAHFEHCLVLTYALRADVLQTQLPPGLEVERFDRAPELGFLAVATVQTRELRPARLPRCVGRDFFLIGYRVFCRFPAAGSRGLRILRSDTDSRTMVCFGNLLTHYNYHAADVHWVATSESLEVRVQTPLGDADLRVTAWFNAESPPLPPGSCFSNPKEARRFAGPLPNTFDYEAETHSIVIIKATRANWSPKPVRVDVHRAAFLEGEPYNKAQPVLVSAFHTGDIGYRWGRGVRRELPRARP